MDAAPDVAAPDGPASASGGAPGSGGVPGTGGRAGTGGGGPGSGGASGPGGAGGQTTCGTYGVSGSVTFTGVTTIAFDRIQAAVTHKRDIDEFEDRCLNRLVFNVGFAAGCSMAITASDCVDGQGRMRIIGIDFSADSQCPSFPDAIEGDYGETSGSIAGSWVTMSAPKVPDRNVASSCVQERFEIALAGRLTESGTTNTLTFGSGSTLIVTGSFVSSALDRVCPTACPGTGGAGGGVVVVGSGGAIGSGGSIVGSGGRPGTGGRVGTGGAGGRGGAGGAGGCQSDSQCSAPLHCYRGTCVPVTNYGPCSMARHCPTNTTCIANADKSGFGCLPNCAGMTICPQPTSGTVAAACDNGTFCNLYCGAGGTCPTGMTCSVDVCYWP
jgi:hypothetical protein